MENLDALFVLFSLGAVFAASQFADLVGNMLDDCWFPLTMTVAAAFVLVGVAAFVAEHLRRRRERQAATLLERARQRVRERVDLIIWGGL